MLETWPNFYDQGPKKNFKIEKKNHSNVGHYFMENVYC